LIIIHENHLGPFIGTLDPRGVRTMAKIEDVSVAPGLQGIPDEVSEFFRSKGARSLIVCGAPGSGKTTFAIQLLQDLDVLASAHYESTRASDQALLDRVAWLGDGPLPHGLEHASSTLGEEKLPEETAMGTLLKLMEDGKRLDTEDEASPIDVKLVMPDAWLAIDFTIDFRTAHWWIPFGTPVKIVRLVKAGYIVHLVPPRHGVPPTIYVLGLDSLLWERPGPDTVAHWLRYKSAFKEILRREYEPRLHQLWEKLKLLSDREAAGPAPETPMDRTKERDVVMDELRDIRDTMTLGSTCANHRPHCKEALKASASPLASSTSRAGVITYLGKPGSFWLWSCSSIARASGYHRNLIR